MISKGNGCGKWETVKRERKREGLERERRFFRRGTQNQMESEKPKKKKGYGNGECEEKNQREREIDSEREREGGVGPSCVNIK